MSSFSLFFFFFIIPCFTCILLFLFFFFFFFNDTATTEIYTLSLHDALPISEIGVVHAVLHDRMEIDQFRLECGEFRGELGHRLLQLPDAGLLERGVHHHPLGVGGGAHHRRGQRRAGGLPPLPRGSRGRGRAGPPPP